jgi:hypothetical protein
MRQILFSLAGLLFVTVSSAAPITYACRMTTDPLFTSFGVIDQISVDREAQTFELRNAKTMGTSNEINWLYKDLDTPEDTVIWHVIGSDDAVAGTRFGIPFIFRSTGPLFGLTFGDGLPFVYYEWSCTS